MSTDADSAIDAAAEAQPQVEVAADREDLTQVPDAARTRHRDLSEELDRYAFAYYVRDEPLVSDGQYDELMGELKAIEAAHRALVTPESPSQKVNGGFAATFAPVQHLERMQSLDNVFSREELDAFSLESHRRATAAADEGRFDEEIVPIDLTNPHAGVVLGVDETPRRDTSAAALAALKPAFLPEGKVTAGNSSQICDGAAAVLVAGESAAGRLGLEPRARFVSFGLAGVDPHRMLHGNPQACDKALARAGLTWDDMSVIEVNEAFACVVLQFARDAGLEDRWDDINPNGGGISLGHPLGATGARITATLLNELERRDAQYGIATMCIGFGQALACVVERV